MYRGERLDYVKVNGATLLMHLEYYIFNGLGYSFEPKRRRSQSSGTKNRNKTQDSVANRAIEQNWRQIIRKNNIRMEIRLGDVRRDQDYRSFTRCSNRHQSLNFQRD